MKFALCYRHGRRVVKYQICILSAAFTRDRDLRIAAHYDRSLMPPGLKGTI